MSVRAVPAATPGRCALCTDGIWPGQMIAPVGVLPYKRTRRARRFDGTTSYRRTPPKLWAHDECVRGQQTAV